MKRKLYYGCNSDHEFWEDEANDIVILRPYHESTWTAHRNFIFIRSGSAKELAEVLDAELSKDKLWVFNNMKFELKKRAGVLIHRGEVA